MRLRLLGEMELRSPAGEPVRLVTRKTAWLLAALALAGEKGASRDALCEALWGDRGETQARGSLRQALASLRHDIGAAEEAQFNVAAEGDRLRLVARHDEVDVWLFERLAAEGNKATLRRASDLYRGDLLQGVAVSESFEQWILPRKRALQQQALAIADHLSTHGPGDDAALDAGAALAERLLAADPAAETAHRALIRIHMKRGQTSAAARQFEECRRALRRDLGVEPERQTRALLATATMATAAAEQATGGGAIPAPTPPTPAPRGREQPALVVMRFDNLSSAEDGYFVDGVVEEVTAALSRVRAFFVIARQSAFAYQGGLKDVRQIARDLGVDYVVQGTVRRGNDRLRISVQLVDAGTGTQLWSERYDGTAADVFAFQDSIAAHVADAVQPALRSAEIERAKRRPPASTTTYDLVMRAYPDVWSHDPSRNRRAIGHLRQAIAIDSGYGRAHALLAWCHSQEIVYLWSDDADADRKLALAAIDAAMADIEDDPTALTAAGAALSQCGFQDRATVLLEKALALDPNNAWAWARLGWAALYQGEADRSRTCFDRSLTLSPLDPLAFNLRVGTAGALAMKGAYAEAVRILRAVVDAHPSATWVNRPLAAWSVHAGDPETAHTAIKRFLAASPNATIELMRTQHPQRQTPDFFERMIDGLRKAGLPEK